MNDFTQRLTELFEQVESQFRADTVARYRAQAEAQLAGWLKQLEGPEPKRGPWYSTVTACPEYVTWEGGMGTMWQAKVEAANDENYHHL